jgi:hypothetical protein
MCLVQVWLHKDTTAICKAIVNGWKVAIHQLCQGFYAGFLVTLHAYEATIPRASLQLLLLLLLALMLQARASLAWYAQSKTFSITT